MIEGNNHFQTYEDLQKDHIHPELMRSSSGIILLSAFAMPDINSVKTNIVRACITLFFDSMTPLSLWCGRIPSS